MFDYLNTAILIAVTVTALIPMFFEVKFKKEDGRSKLITPAGLIFIALSIVIFGLTLWKNQNDKENAADDKAKLTKEFADLRLKDSIEGVKAVVADSIQSVYSRNYIIDSLNRIHRQQSALMQGKIDSLLQKTLNRRLTTKEKNTILAELKKFKGIKCVNIKHFPFTSPKLADQVLSFLTESGYEVMGSGMVYSTNFNSFEFVQLKGVEAVNNCIVLEVGSF